MNGDLFPSMSLEDDLKRSMLIQQTIGILLARGYTSNEILDELTATQAITPEEASKALRTVYDSWAAVREDLNIQAEDERNWHVYLRMQVLKGAMGDTGVAARRLALATLDSLASIQGIKTELIQTTPLPIILVPKQEMEEKKENNDGSE